MSFEPRRSEPVSLERFWDEVAWQRCNLAEGDTLVPDPERRSFSVCYRAGGLPAERSATVTATGAETTFLSHYDHTAESLANPRLDDGTLLSAELLAQEALDADVYCGVFNADWTNLALGRSRDASDAQRLILAARDRGCAHCGAHTETTHAHHATPHAQGGRTEIPNLELLCEPCHTHHHQPEHDNRADSRLRGRPSSRGP